jgi:hypothetical protein
VFVRGPLNIIKRIYSNKPIRPILTYGEQATTKRGVKPQHHAIIYTEAPHKRSKWGKPAPKLGRPKEIAGEERLEKKAIRVVPLQPDQQLHPCSRLNYAKLYTIEYNVKVCFIGRIHDKSVKYLTRDYNLQHRPLPEKQDDTFSEDEQSGEGATATYGDNTQQEYGNTVPPTEKPLSETGLSDSTAGPSVPAHIRRNSQRENPRPKGTERRRRTNTGDDNGRS